MGIPVETDAGPCPTSACRLHAMGRLGDGVGQWPSAAITHSTQKPCREHKRLVNYEVPGARSHRCSLVRLVLASLYTPLRPLESGRSSCEGPESSPRCFTRLWYVDSAVSSPPTKPPTEPLRLHAHVAVCVVGLRPSARINLLPEHLDVPEDGWKSRRCEFLTELAHDNNDDGQDRTNMSTASNYCAHRRHNIHLFAIYPASYEIRS